MSKEEEYTRGFDDGIKEAEEAEGKAIEDVVDFEVLHVIEYKIPEGALTESEAYQEGKEAGVKYYHDKKAERNRWIEKGVKDRKEAIDALQSLYDEEKKKKR